MTAVVAGLAVLCAGWLLLPGPATVPSAPSGLRWPVLVTGLAVAGWFVGPLLVVAGLVLVAGRVLWRQRRRRQVAEETSARVLETCELLAAEVGSGQPPPLALARAAEAWPLLAPAAETGTLGGDVPAVLRGLAQHPGAEQLRLVAAAWAVAHRTGGGLADALGRVTAALRADRATRRVVDGELASARATARLVAVLPVLVLLLGSGTGGGAWTFLLDTPAGWACLAAGLGLGLLGLGWIERIAAGVVR